jgi:hypothetical protein
MAAAISVRVCLAFETALFVGFHLVVRILLKCVEDIFVAGLAGM